MRFFSTLAASTLGALLAILLFFFFGFLFILALAASSDPTPSVRSNSVLVFDLSGSIPDRVTGDPIAQALGLEARYGMWDVTEGLRKAAADDRIDALWVRMRASAIAWPVASEIRQAIELFQESGKPVIASSEDFPVTENALYIASAADSVFAGPGTFVEFNGFYIQSEFYKGLLDKLEVEPQIVRAGDFKSAVEPFQRTSLSDENRAQLEAILDTQEKWFATAIGTSRGMEPERVLDIMTNFGLGTTEEAVEVGLIDDVQHHDETIAVLRGLTARDDDDDLRTVRMGDYIRVPARQAGLPSPGTDEIAVIQMQGAIVSGSGSAPGMLTPSSVRNALRSARESDRVKAVVLRINSPGGSAAASDAILDDIRETADAKPLYVSMGSVAASGGYWIAMAADTIVADPVTITGSIGVYSLFMDVGDFYSDKLGITHDVLRTHPQADMLSGMRPFTALERRRMQESVESTYRTFVGLVSQNRNMTPEQVDDIGGGRVWSGDDAVEVGLVDVLGGLGDTIEMAAGRVGLERDDYRVRMYPRPATFLERLNSSFSVQLSRLKRATPLTAIERDFLMRARQFESLTSDIGSVQARFPFDVVMR